MPTYQVYVNEGRLDAGQKAAVAAAITDAHAAQTGAPKYYVQVVVNEIPDGNRFVSGVKFGRHIWIRGDVRIRTPEQNRELMLALVEGVHRASGFERGMIWCDLAAVEPTNIFKFGAVFPPAGHEQAWYDALPEEAKETIKRLVAGDA